MAQYSFPIELLVETEVAGLRFDDLDSILRSLCDAQVNLLIESATTHDGGIQQVWPVGGSNYKYLIL
jgi:hypothetical protein